ncbi:hypothetical protein AAG570_005619 [Ranatra chinensis]|uniref:Uncharacterized protein n=1 Tax=Ranatra chinensis TaxID=642074 RepID=A0ABD0XXY4_9HEMI
MTSTIISLVFCLLTVSRLGSCGEYALDDPEEEYKRMLDEFLSRAGDVMQSLDAQRDEYFANLQAKIESRQLDLLTRSKRDTSSDSDDMMAKLNKAFAVLKESVQSAMSDISKSDVYQDAQSKLKEFGETLSETGKKFGAKIQDGMKDMS